MGYYIYQNCASFFINKEHFSTAVKILYDLIKKEVVWNWVSPVNKLEKDPQKAIKQLLTACRWDPSFDENGNIDNIQFIGKNLGQEEQLFQALAPYVKKDSYIELSGEEGEIWRYEFDGNKMEENFAELDFDCNKEIVEKILKQKKLLPTLMGLHPKLDDRISKVLMN